MSVILDDCKLVCVVCRKLALVETPIIYRIFIMPQGENFYKMESHLASINEDV